MISNTALADEVVRDLRSDASYLRFADGPDERQFLTGIEVLTIAATLAVMHFWKGVFEAAGRTTGEKAIEVFLSRVNRAVQRLKRVDLTSPKELPQAARTAQEELDEAVRAIVSGWPPMQLRARLEASVQEQVALVAGYLRDAGFPPEEAQRHALRICERLRARIDGT